ncbi:kelch-like protein 5 isoform X2 [Arctopsyche grandis]|uniref:kelch-like protein 5 isoform X2 n=1 Tax=Arctopsyche grandis TaxID=121162 RepID=UPI00406D7BDB
MNSFRKQNLFCDAVFLVDSERVVMASASKYFETIFNEARSKVPPQDTFTERIEKVTLEAIIDFCYSGKIELNDHNVGSIQTAATTFQMKPLITTCNEFLQRRLSSNKCSITKTITEINSFITAENEFVQNTIANFMDVYKTPRFLQSSLERIIRIIQSDDLNVPKEDYVFEAVRQWLLHDLHNQQHMEKLFTYIRFPLITKEFLFDKVTPFCESFSQSNNIVINTLRLHLIPSSRINAPPQSLTPRKSASRIFAVGSWQTQTSSDIEMYDQWEDTWYLYARMNIKKSNYGAAIIDDKLLIVGGFDSQSLTSVESFDLNSGILTKLPPLKEKRSNVGAVILGQNTSAVLFAIGGWNDNTSLDTVEKCDLSINHWSYAAPMIYKRDAFGICTFNGKIYVAGGRSGNSFLDTVEVYDPSRNAWGLQSSLKSQRSYCSLMEAGGYLYVVGGYRGTYGIQALSTIERFDPDACIWTIYENLPYTRGLVGAGLLGNFLVSVGGSSSAPRICLENFDLFDLRTKTWKSGKTISPARSGVHVFSVPWNLLNTNVLTN